MFPSEKSPKISIKFYCECCDYKCSKQSEYTKHILTAKHKNLQNPTLNPTKKSPKQNIIVVVIKHINIHQPFTHIKKM
jgi:hypothetical protein